MILEKNNFVSNPFSNSYICKNSEGYIMQFYNPPIIDRSTCTLHTVKPGETLQEIAAFIYGDSGLWFIIAEANNILNPFKEVKDGMILLIPTNYAL